MNIKDAIECTRNFDIDWLVEIEIKNKTHNATKMLSYKCKAYL